MTRFVRTRDLSGDSPGMRLRFERQHEHGSQWVDLAIEMVLPEQTHNPDARRVREVASLDLDDGDIAWLHAVTDAYLAERAIAGLTPHDPTGSPVVAVCCPRRQYGDGEHDADCRALAYEAQRAADPDIRDEDAP